MKSKLTAPTLEDTGALIAIAATLFGTWMRLMPPALASFPINDGGLFYVMMGAVRANAYRIPQFVQYNGLDIPFAYPPLAFYMGAGLADLLHVPDLMILQWFPAVVLIFTIPAFFLLAEAITGSRFQAGIATLLFALVPRSIYWLIMGGGLTRSLGQLFLMLSAWQLYWLFSKPTLRSRVLAIVFCTLVMFTHQEASLHTAAIAILFWTLLSRNRRGIADAAFVGIAVLLFSSIWFIPVLFRHGASPWMSAYASGMHNYLNIFNAFRLTFAAEPFVTIVSVLGLIGAALSLTRKEYLLIAWILLSFILEQRNAPNVAVIALCILASKAVTESIIPALDDARAGGLKSPPSSQLRLPGFLFLVFIGLYSLGGMAFSNAGLVAMTPSPEDRKAFEWVKNHLPSESKLLILTGERDLFADGVSEWFPALTGRIGVNVIQGQEWLIGADFMIKAEIFQEIQACSDLLLPMDCFQAVSASKGISYDYLYVSEQSDGYLHECWQGEEAFEETLGKAIFSVVYRCGPVSILKVSSSTSP